MAETDGARTGGTRYLHWVLFLGAFCAYGWFNQGGGWNQNSRFAEARALVEEGRFTIDDFLVYERAGGEMLRREPIVDGDVTLNGERIRIAWPLEHGELSAVNGHPADSKRDLASLEKVVSSGDIGFYGGHFHPNKAPGLGFLAAAAYFPIFHVERRLAVPTDGWWTLTCNLWLVTVCVSGLLSAAGVAIFYRTALLFAPGAVGAAFAASVAFAFGTMFFPFATILFDNNAAGVFLLVSFYILFRQCAGGDLRAGWIFGSGLCAGLAGISNYVAGPAAVLIGLYLIAKLRRKKAWIWYGLGLLAPVLLLGGYCYCCFDRPFAFNTDFQNPVFKEHHGALLGMFGLPHPEVAAYLFFSPFRGIFYTAPILIAGFYGLAIWLPRAGYRLEAGLFLLLFLLFFGVNLSFNGWHGGFSSEARYLGPAMPFVALPLVFGFLNVPRLCGVLTVFSVAMQLLITAVDVQSPVGTGSLAMAGQRPQWMCSPLADYVAPLFFYGRPWPVLQDLIADKLRAEELSMNVEGSGTEEAEARIKALRPKYVKAAEEGDPEPFLLATFRGPVSVNPVGVYEGGFYHLFPPGSEECRWNSFNAGEFLFPNSRWSLAPLGAILVALGGAGVWRLRSMQAG